MKISFKLSKFILIGSLFSGLVFGRVVNVSTKSVSGSNRLEDYTIQNCTETGCLKAAGGKAYITAASTMMFGTAVLLEVQKNKVSKSTTYLCNTFRYHFKNQIVFCEVSNEKERAAYIIKPQLEIRKFSLM